MDKAGQFAARYLVNGDFGSVRDSHSLALMFFMGHADPRKAYGKLKKIAMEVHAELLVSEPERYSSSDPEEATMLVEHHPQTDARVNGLMLLAMFRFIAAHPDIFVTLAAEF